VVEARVPNHALRFLPGQYVVMQISTGRRSDVLRAPTAAIRWRTAASGSVLSTRTTPYVWLAESSEREGEFVVRAVEITQGLSDGERTEVLSGLQEGQRVVTAGDQYLKNGDTVTPVDLRGQQP
jgi:HlyD family secretion protein